MFGFGIGGILKGATSGNAIRLSNNTVSKAVKLLEDGAVEVTVRNADEAGEAFLRVFQARGYRNTTGFTGNEVRSSPLLFPEGKYGTYHWDLADTQHGGRPHVQIHPFRSEPNQNIVRIMFGEP